MTTQTEALKLALEALESCDEGDWSTGHVIHPSYDEDAVKQAMIAIEEALSQPEQEPVAMRHSFNGHGYKYTDIGFGNGWVDWTKHNFKDVEPLYTTPPQRKPMTDEQIKEITLQIGWTQLSADDLKFCRAIEAAHGIKE